VASCCRSAGCGSGIHCDASRVSGCFLDVVCFCLEEWGRGGVKWTVRVVC
jgi:hypothetical protein